LGDGSVVRDYIFVDDVIDALEAAMNDQSSARIFNIGSGSGRSLLDIIGAVENLSSTKLEIARKEGRSIDVPKVYSCHRQGTRYLEMDTEDFVRERTTADLRLVEIACADGEKRNAIVQP
jgi:UDP-glucose 4-epimerase